VAFKKPAVSVAVPESPDRLFRDLPRRKHPSLFDHQGQMLRNYVAKALTASDVALQLPTGSGKTLVGLLLAEWRRRKYRERVVYLCPTKQLVNQVAEEASTKYGLSIEAFTGQIRDYTPAAKAAYEGGEKVAVTNYSSLFNTNPFFRSPDIVIVDDAHAAENYIASQWTLTVSRYEESTKESTKALHAAVASVLKQAIPAKSYARLVGEARGVDDVTWVDKLPTHVVAALAEELRVTIDASIGELQVRYAWRMLADHLQACQIYMSSTEIMIRPLIPPTWTHAPFAGAKQRIFMSATLGAGGDLERLTGRPKIARLPIPDGWDRQGIGRRFFIFPEKSLTEGDTLALRRSLMRTAGRSLVLTPTNELAKAVSEDVATHLKYPVYSASNLELTKSAFTESPQAVAVIANRYDGIDFPEDDCRLQFIEGLPRATNLQERFLMTRMGANLLFNERVQTRVMQAVGRCTRGLNDFSAVVVTGEDLPAYLTDLKRRSHFHPELQAEIEFGILQSTNTSAAEVEENFRVFLEHDREWEDADRTILESRDAATQEPFPAMEELAQVVAGEIEWQTAMWNEDYVKAHDAARDVLASLNDSRLRGYRALWHYLAGSSAELAASSGERNFEALARQHYRQAKEAANGIPWLVALARGAGPTPSADDAERETQMLQVEQLESSLVKLGTLHNRAFAAREQEIRAALSDATTFEQGQVLLGKHLGFAADKRETDASPDPWWAIGDLVIVFEDHAGAGADAVVDATKARQAASHPDWIRSNVPGAEAAKIVPVLVTPVSKATSGAMPSLKKVCYWGVDGFRQWAEQALVVIRDLRRTFREPGDLAWRAEAAEALVQARIDGPTLAAWLLKRPASDYFSGSAE
jgi:hypothetical protein